MINLTVDGGDCGTYESAAIAKAYVKANFMYWDERQIQIETIEAHANRMAYRSPGCWNKNAKTCDCPACGGYND